MKWLRRIQRRALARRRGVNRKLVARVLAYAGRADSVPVRLDWPRRERRGAAAVMARDIAAELGRLDDELLELEGAAQRAQVLVGSLVTGLSVYDPALAAALFELDQAGGGEARP